jgi:ABC-2 type transport system permease protein
MRAISIIFRRELGAYLRSPVGYLVAALSLAAVGMLFQGMAMGEARLSADVLFHFFQFASGAAIVVAAALAIRLVAEERQQHTIVLLHTSPVRDVEIILGKFLAAFVFLAAILLLSFYMPLLIMVHGKISFEQVAVGYLGLLLLGSASLAIGVFASSLARHQLVAVAVAATLLTVMWLFFHVGRVVDPPLKDFFTSLGLVEGRFLTSFARGVLSLKDVVYYLAVTYFFLLLATKTMEAKRWQ